jgi:hypothetical protein
MRLHLSLCLPALFVRRQMVLTAKELRSCPCGSEIMSRHHSALSSGCSIPLNITVLLEGCEHVFPSANRPQNSLSMGHDLPLRATHALLLSVVEAPPCSVRAPRLPIALNVGHAMLSPCPHCTLHL